VDPADGVLPREALPALPLPALPLPDLSLSDRPSAPSRAGVV
jgi:hypothetical protein